MKLEYKYVLGEDYYIIEGWEISNRVRLTGVRFNGDKIWYAYTHGKVQEVEESKIASTLKEAKEKCLKTLDEFVTQTKEQMAGLTDMDF